jgi:hypothetical protein
MSVTCVKDFDLEKLNRTSKHKNKIGGEAVYFTYENSKKIILQTDKLYTSFGISENNVIELDISDSSTLLLLEKLEQNLKEEYDTEDVNIRSIINNNILKLKVQTKDQLKTVIFSSNKDELEAIDNDINLQCLLQFIGIWFKNNEYGISVRLLQIKTYEKEEQLNGYSFIDDDSELPDIVPNDF